jgi:hypothetical protein
MLGNCAVCEYERGSLEAKVEDGTYVERTLEGLDLLVRIARELEKLHNAGVAHRDLKPANILLGDDGPLLADFGLCLPIDHTDERFTETAEQVGSRFYIAPENESGINDDVDQRPADFYAFGKMAWVLLAGRRPFARELTGNPKLRLQAIRQDERFAILDDLLDELMNFDPRARLVDWSVVIGELAAFQDVLQGAPAPSRPMNLEETLRLARRARRLPELLSAAQERQDEAKASQWINGHLIQPLFPLAARIQNELAELTGAADAAITFQISTGGAELRRLVEVEPRFAFPEYIPSMVSPNQTSGAPVLYTIQSIAEPEIPTLYLGLYVVRIRRQFWILRVPILAYPPGPLPGSMIDRYYRRIGPLPVGRQASFDRAAELCRETMALFLDMAHRYLAAVSQGTHPLDESVWLADPQGEP